MRVFVIVVFLSIPCVASAQSIDCSRYVADGADNGEGQLNDIVTVGRYWKLENQFSIMRGFPPIINGNSSMQSLYQICQEEPQLPLPMAVHLTYNGMYLKEYGLIPPMTPP